MANEVQRITYAATPEAGDYTLTFDGEETGAIAWDDNAAAIQAALEALPNIGSGNVEVTGSGPFDVEFIGDLADANQPELTANSSLKQAADTIGISTLQAGSDDVNEVQTILTTGCTPEVGGFEINGQAVTVGEGGLVTNLAAAMDAAHGSGNTSVSGNEVTFLGSLAGQNIAEMTISNNTTDGTPSVTTDQQGGAGQHHIFSVTLSDAPTEGRLGAGDGGGQLGDYWDFDDDAAAVETSLEGGGDPFPCTVTGSAGGPWTIENDANGLLTDVAGLEDAGTPLRKACGISISTITQGSAASAGGDSAARMRRLLRP